MTTNTPDVPEPDTAPLFSGFPEPLEPQEPPMHLYVCSPPAAPASPAAGPVHPIPSRELSASVTQILEQVNAQNQLLVDLLGAVNGLTAAILCRRPDR